MRNKTRRERYNLKKKTAVSLPLGIVTVNFDFNDNLAFTIRTAACYGAYDIHVIGSIPDRSLINPKSGSLVDYVNLHSYSNPSKFLQWSRKNNIKLISAELSDDATSLFDYDFNFCEKTCLVLGHETTGIPVEILMNSEKVYVPMPGIGFCLNTSQTGTAIMTEYVRQYFKGSR